MEAVTYEQFVGSLRSALHHLYNPVHLRASPLIALLGLADEFDSAAALQQTLAQAVRRLKPSEDEPPQSRAWRVYDTLNFHYLRQLSRDAVALQLGISERQLRREQRVALEVLAQHLWPQIEHAAIQIQTPTQPAATLIQLPADADQALIEELAWLKTPTPEQRMPLGAALQTVHRLAQPLAQQWQTSLQIEAPVGLADLPVAPLPLRSILLTILSVAIPRAGQNAVLIAAARQGATLEFRVTCEERPTDAQPFSAKEMAGLEMARNLAVFYDAHLSLPQAGEASFAVTLALPAPEQIPVLVIDDNADWLALLQRYATDSRYQVVGTRDPTGAHSLAEQLQPSVILLDVMMHHVDGWQILSDLRHAPATHLIPIVICTILPVEELALALGANAFLQKPITQYQFLRTLDEQVG